MTEQVEFYFSDENLPTDMHMLEQLAKGEGRVSVKHIVSFRRMKRMMSKARKKMKNVLIVKNADIVTTALSRNSNILIVSEDKSWISRKIPFTGVNMLDKSKRTCTVRFPRAAKGVDSVREQFESAKCGKVLVVKFEENTQQTKATVEFETEKQMMEACEALNDIDNWRFGLRVEPMLDAQKKILKKKATQRKKIEAKKKKQQHQNQQKKECEDDKGLWGSRFKPRKPRKIRFHNNTKKDEETSTSTTTSEDKGADIAVLCKYAKGPDGTIGFSSRGGVSEKEVDDFLE